MTAQLLEAMLILWTSSFSEVDDEGYLRVSKGRLSFDESEDDRIYEEIKS